LKQSGECTGDAGDQYTGLDRFGRVVDQRWLATGSGTALDRFQYGYDRDSNVLWKNNLVNTAFGELYSYDNLNQLSSFQRGTLNSTHTAITGTPSASQSWSPDAVGNFSSVTTNGTTQTRSANAQNEITSISSATTPTYDSNGNMTGDETGRQLIYDAWNRLVKVKNSGGATIWQSSYDALDRRVQQTESSTTTDFYFSDAGQVLEERVGSNVMAQYVWSAVYVDAMILRDRSTNGGASLNERLWVQQDADFNVTALVNTSGSVTERSVEDPYGSSSVYDSSWNARSGSSFGWLHYFQDKRIDTIIGSIDFGERFYSPTLMRFVQNDPIGFAGGDQNLSRTEGDNPVVGLDPSGLETPSASGITSDGKPTWFDYPILMVGGLFGYNEHDLGYNVPDPWATRIEVGSGSAIVSVRNNHNGVSEKLRARVPLVVKQAIERITTANHLLVNHWDCILKVLRSLPWRAQGLPGKTPNEMIEVLENNKDYLMKKFQQASDRLLDGREILFFITDQTEDNNANARTYPNLGYISLRLGFFEALRKPFPTDAIRIMAHELGRLHGDQSQVGTWKPGDVHIWDVIIYYLHKYKDQILDCAKQTSCARPAMSG
jgi:RHS repeat-associated protein